ncbi:MAG: hypothetical protein NXI30_02695 [bacterium]|nr:hypothetical protein [bacterium]
MIAAGAAAASRIPLVDRAREAMRALGDELGLPSSLLVRGGNAFVFVDRHALPDPLAETIHVGFRLPLQAPLGASLMAWSSRKDFDAWASGLGGIVARRGIEKSIAAIRERGFEVTLRTTAEARLFEELRELRLRVNRPDVGDVSARIVPLFRKETYLLDEIDRDATYSVSCITAPIHGAAPHPGIAIALGGPSLDLRGREIEEIGARLLARIRSFHDDTERDAHA